MWLDYRLLVMRGTKPSSSSSLVRRRDYIVGFISDDRIIEAATQWRALGVPRGMLSFDVTVFIVDYLKNFCSRPMRLVISDHGSGDYLAYVTYEPNPVMHIDIQIWHDAKLGEPLARYMLMHECGHVIFHSHHAKAFSNSEEKYINSVVDQERPEYHANLFADHMLVPDTVVKLLKTADAIAQNCDVEMSVADRRIESYSKKFLRSLHTIGECCPNCGEPLYQRGITTFCKAKTCLYAFVN